MTIDEAKKRAEAKLQCMERDVSGKDDDCNNRRCYECPLNYEQGNMREQKEWLRMAIQALEQTTWIPCSERLPNPQKYGDKDYSDWVEVTILIGLNKDAYVGEAYYCFSENKWYAKRFVVGEVTAWQPLPKPYLPDINVGNMSRGKV